MAPPKKNAPKSAPVAAEPVVAAVVEEVVAPVDPLAPVEVALEPHDAALAQLGSERIQNAQLHLQNRKNEFEGLLGQIRTKYEENGKYTMSSIDLGKGTITRALRA